MIIPAIGLGTTVLLEFRGTEYVTLLAFFTSSTAISSFTMAQQLGLDAVLAGNIVISTNALCTFTLFMWSYFSKMAGLF